MLKKSLKNILLVCSVLLMFFLVWQIWFGSYFLPDGYRYLTTSFRTHILNTIQRLFDNDSNKGLSQNMKVLFQPEKIIINHSGNRVVFQRGNYEFDTIKKLSDDFLGQVLLEQYAIKAKETVSVETYHALLKGKTIYVDYGKNCDFDLFSSVVHNQNNNPLTEDIGVLSEFVIGLHDSVMNDVSLYIPDQKSHNIYRYVIETDKSALDTKIKEYLNKVSPAMVPSYSFELNFHKEQENSVAKVLFEPLVLLDLMPVSMPPIEMVGMAEENRARYDELTDEFLNMFSVNTRTMRRYTDLDDARVFVENNATLTLYPNGLLEYQAVQGSRGLDISRSTDRTQYDVFQAVADAIDFVTELCSLLPDSYFEHLQISTHLVNSQDRQNAYKLSFDYYINGAPVRHKTESGYSATIEMEVTEGYLTSYRQHLKAYKQALGEVYQLPPVLSAADDLVNALYNGNDPLHIEKVGICYTVDETGVITPKWFGRVDGIERMFE